MSYDSANWLKPSSKKYVFSGGLCDNAFSNQLADHQSPYLRNARLDGYGIKIRPGFSLFSTLAAGSYPKGIGYYNRVSSANDRLIVRHNISGTQKLYSIDSAGTATAITTAGSITSDNRMSFTNGNEVIYCMNGSDLFGQVSGTTFSQITANVPANFAPAFSVVFNGSMWASGWPTNPLKVYKSVGQNYSDFSSAGSDSLSFPGPVTGLAATNELLAYFTSETVSATTTSDIIDTGGTLTYVSRNIQAKEGSVNHASIVSAGNSLYYITPTNKIVQIRRGDNVNGFEVVELSERAYNGISDLMNSLDADQSESFGYFYAPDSLIKWHFKSEGATFNDVCVIYDIEKDAFLVDTQKFFYAGTMWGEKAYTVSMIEPKVFRDEYAQDDEDSAIPFEYWTKRFDLGMPTRKKCLWETRTFLRINELAELTQQVWIDDALVDTFVVDSDAISIPLSGIGTQEVGSFPVGEDYDPDTDEMQEVDLLRSKGVLNKKGRKVQFRYSCSTLAAKAELLDLDLKTELLPEIATQLIP